MERIVSNEHWPAENRVGGYTYVHQFPKHDFIMASYEPFGKNRYIDITGLLNSL